MGRFDVRGFVCVADEKPNGLSKLGPVAPGSGPLVSRVQIFDATKTPSGTIYLI